MTEGILYIDTSEVREGALEDLKRAIEALAAFVESNEPDILAYNVYLSEDGKRMTVAHLHRDSASLEYHMEVAGPQFLPFVDLITLKSITIFGRPSLRALEQLQAKAASLGDGTVTVDELQAGFTRLA